jgi:MYXO-CTERM domain-containing protein
MSANRFGNSFAMAAMACALAFGPGSAGAQTIGGTTAMTLEYHVNDITQLSRTDILETYSTRMLGFLTGQADPLVDIQFSLPFGDDAVQAAIATTRQMLAAASADPLQFTGPMLTSSSRALTGSSSASSDLLTSEDVLWVHTAELVGEELFHLNSAQFGCVAEVAGIKFDCTEDFGDLFVAAGNTVLLTSGGIVHRFNRTTVFTETYLNSSTYQITGTPTSQPVPEPGTAPLAALAALAGLAALRRRAQRG